MTVGAADAAGPGVLRSALVDGLGRVHRDLRISLTDRCNLRCTYCLPADGVPWLGSSTLLSLTETVRVARVAVERGVDQIRLTGGEPLLRPDVVDVVAALADLPGRPEVTMTTNGIRLGRLARPLVEAGLSRVNVSLDTVDRERFARLTRRDRFDEVLAGLDAADEAGLTGTKTNSVLLRGVNDDEVCDLVRFAHGRGYEPRFIEQMPLDAGRTWARSQMVRGDEVLAWLRDDFDLVELPGRRSAPAQRWQVRGTASTVGIIASVSRPFCGACDRIRLTADGQLLGCLFATAETDVRALLRRGGSDDEIAAALGLTVLAKAAGHTIAEPGFDQPGRPMSAIGG